MAIEMSKAVSLQLRLVDGAGDGGSPKYVTRSFSGINPETSEDNLAKAAKALASLMSKPMVSSSRVEKTDLVEDVA